MPMGLLDLSIITDHLIQMLRDCISASALWNAEPPEEGAPVGVNPGQPITIGVTGNAPDVLRDGGGCQLSLYLFHVALNPYQRNTPVVGDRKQVQTTPFQPLSLDLYYLLSAYSDSRYIEEQQAMSIALKCFHEHPIVHNVVLANDGRPRGEFCLTLETETPDTLARLWQATTTSLRLATVYKVSVVFIQPQEDRRPLAPKPQKIGLTMEPTALPYAADGQLLGAARHVRYIGPDDVPADPNRRDFRDYDLMPAVVAPGQNFLLYGAGLANPNPPPAKTVQIFLLRPGQPDMDVTAWLDADPANQTPTRMRLNVPDPAPIPAGVYQLRAAIDDVPTNATPFSLAARVDAPADPPVLPFGGAALTLTGAGFVPGSTQVLLGTVPLTENAAVGPGQFAVTGGGTEIQFRPPNNLLPGRYGMRVRVNEVESDPAVWVQI